MAAKDVPPKSHPCQLLVEGRDEVFAIADLLKRRGYAYPSCEWFPFIRDCKSVDKVLKLSPLTVKGANVTNVGVVLDADAHPLRRWESLRGRMSSVGVELPQAPDEDGTVVGLEGLAALDRVGVWLMPDNSSSGMLEDFLARLIPPDDPVWPHATAATQAAVELGAPLKEAHLSKGKLHAFLAWQEPPALPFGTAISARVLGTDRPEADRFVAWMVRTFGSAAS